MPAQHRDELRIEKALVAHLDRVPHRPRLIDFEVAAAVHPGVAAPRELERRVGRARQQREEGFEASRVEAHLRRKLPEDRPQLVGRCSE